MKMRMRRTMKTRTKFKKTLEMREIQKRSKSRRYSISSLNNISLILSRINSKNYLS